MGYLRGKVFDASGNAIPNAVVSCPGLNIIPVFASLGITGTYFGYGVNGNYTLTASANNKSRSVGVTVCDLLQEVNIFLP